LDTSRAVEPLGSAQARRFWLEIEPGVTPITGRLGVGQREWAFAGWLELAAVLDTAITSGGRP
jgi:hypothetical protein